MLMVFIGECLPNEDEKKLASVLDLHPSMASLEAQNQAAEAVKMRAAEEAQATSQHLPGLTNSFVGSTFCNRHAAKVISP